MPLPTLVVMAAGIGSRYGGLKQIDPIGPNGEILLDYSIYDAVRAGFGTAVFVIRRDIEDTFRARISGSIENKIRIRYVFQELDNLPNGFTVPEGRTKPWGTGHAVMCCAGTVETPFAVINADDYYGRTAFSALAEYLRNAEDCGSVYNYCMVGYALKNTLSEHGEVARGVCRTDENGYLVDICERTRILRRNGGIAYTENGKDWINLPGETVVSLNTWGFTPGFLDELRFRFGKFLSSIGENAVKAEFFLPSVVGELIEEKKARVKVLRTDEKWYGVTYQDDRPVVQAAIRRLIEDGVYPEKLWN